MASIMMLSTVHKPYDNRILYKEAVSLAQAGHTVYFTVPHTKQETVEGVTILPLPEGGGRLERMLKKPLAALKTVKKIRPDAVHIHDSELLPLALWLKMRGYKVIYDSHEDLPRQILTKHWIKESRRQKLARRVEKFENFAARRMNMVVAATEHIAERFRKVNPNTIVLCNFPRLSDFPLPAPWEKRTGGVAYVGGIFKPRGASELVDAAEICGEALHLVGNIEPEEYRQELMQKPGWAKVTEHGFLNKQGVGEVLAKVKIGAVTLHPMPSYLESLPVKMFEYMAAGIPVIASDFPLWRRMLAGCDCAAFVDPQNPAQIAQAVKDILQGDANAQKMGQRGRAAVEERFNWEHEKDKLVEAYRFLLKAGRQSPPSK